MPDDKLTRLAATADRLETSLRDPLWRHAHAAVLPPEDELIAVALADETVGEVADRVAALRSWLLVITEPGRNELTLLAVTTERPRAGTVTVRFSLAGLPDSDIEDTVVIRTTGKQLLGDSVRVMRGAAGAR